MSVTGFSCRSADSGWAAPAPCFRILCMRTKCPGVGAVLDAHYRGWFVRVVDQRIGLGTLFPLVLYARGHAPFIAPGPDAASSVAGPIGRARGPAESNCGPGYSGGPFLNFVTRPVLTRGSLALGHFGGCSLPCRIEYVARRHGRTLRVSDPPPPGGSGVVLLPLSSARALGPGPIEVTLVVDGHPVARGNTVLPRISTRHR
jgi:hypothetical protein